MTTTVTRAEVAELVARGAQLVEVLPAAEFDELHLAGARNLPLKELATRVDELDRDRAVVVYCHDSR